MPSQDLVDPPQDLVDPPQDLVDAAMVDAAMVDAAMVDAAMVDAGTQEVPPVGASGGAVLVGKRRRHPVVRRAAPCSASRGRRECVPEAGSPPRSRGISS
jgi:hypothetical protein